MNINTFHDQLTAWYQAHKRDLPWRRTREPYPVWVSEVMLQQTQVSTVRPYFETFMDRFPTVKHLAEANEETVLKQWEGLGYYARARNLHQAARRVVNDFDGEVPDTPETFRRLPGVGPYIGAAVMSIAFGRACAVVDGNVKRVLARLYEDATPVNAAGVHGVFTRRAQKLLDHSQPGVYNQAVMELGALVCKPRNPLCGACPVPSGCRAYRHGSTSRFPMRKKRQPTPVYPVSTGVVFRGDCVLITRRPSKGLLGGLWEFPGGKIKKGETAKEACRREIAEETGLCVDVISHLTRIRHAYTHFRIIMDVFICRHRTGRVKLVGPVDYRWVKTDDLHQFPLPKANLKFISLLRKKGGLSSK